MADNVVVAATVQIDTGQANANVQELNKSTDSLQAKLDALTAKNKLAGKAAEDTGTSFSKLKDSIASVPGPLQAASGAVDKVSSSFKALLLNPVVAAIAAIVAGLAFLYKSFTNTFEGGEKMQQVFAGIKAAADVVLDRIFALGGAIIKFFSGDFKGAFEDARKAVTGIGDAITSTYNQVSSLTAKIQDLHKQQLANDLDAAKRGADLAKLREQANDETIPVAKRKAALLELQKVEQDAATKDIALARETAATKNALLSIGTDAALKNRDEITKNNIDAINKETEAATEGRRIGRQIAQATRQEAADRKAAATAAAEAAKKNREQLDAYNTQLSKLRQANALAGITDQYTKEKQLLENKITDEAALIKKEYADKKITRDQFNKLQDAQQQSAQIQRAGLTKKHEADVADSEEKFQKELAGIKDKTILDGITDSRKKEAVQLQITHAQQLAQAIKDYSADSSKFQQIKNAIDADLKAKQDALDAKNKKEDAKKKFEETLKANKSVESDPKASFKAKKAALDADVKANQDAYDAKTITEDQYQDNKRKNSAEAQALDKADLASKLDVASKIGDALGGLADLVGKQTAAGKALSIAQSTIGMITGAIQAFTSLSSIPIVGVELGIVAAAGVIASGIANIKKIVAVQVPGQGSGGTVPSVPALPAAPVAMQSGTQLNKTSIDAVGSAVGKTFTQNSDPARAYVLSGDISNDRDRDARLNRAARLGG